MKFLIIPGSVLALALAACSTMPPHADNATTARVTLAPASGSDVSGDLTLVPMGDGVHVTGLVRGLAPGSTHAIHIHDKGDCSAADASSAGGHFNPTGQAHGKVDSAAHHAGDMNNLVAAADGVARVDLHASGPTLGTGAATDAIGRALIVHAAADDYTSQPSGNAGARVACGVITAR
jgi:Cu-Zn family superoxide dismutase